MKEIRLYKRVGHARPYVIVIDGIIRDEFPQHEHVWEMIRDSLVILYGVENPEKPDFIDEVTA